MASGPGSQKNPTRKQAGLTPLDSAYSFFGREGLAMAEPRIIRASEVESAQLPGARAEHAGWIKRILYPPNIETKGVFFGVAEFNPGHSVHRWHTHTEDKAEGYEVVYPENFEEVYYIIHGAGVMQWKGEEGQITKEEKVSAGDTIFMPAGIVPHQLFNNGTEKIVMVFCGYPTPEVTLRKD
jgi:mannose-6-phosphate isomerase-like protein (cupin superfamily)